MTLPHLAVEPLLTDQTKPVNEGESKILEADARRSLLELELEVEAEEPELICRWQNQRS